LVRGLTVRFEGGRAVEIDAETNAEALRGRAAVDEGAARLGEVALVDREGRIGRLDTVFLTTLLDENAASHIALGSAYANSVAEEDRPLVNRSDIHIDFMIGGDDVAVTGITREGGRVQVLRDVDEAAVVEAQDPDRERGGRERAEDVGEAVVSGAVLRPPVQPEVLELRIEVAPEPDRRAVRVAARHVAVDVRVEAAVRAAGVEVDEHLRLSVSVEVADAHRAAGLADDGPVTRARARVHAPRRRVEERRPAPRDSEAQGAVHVV